MVVAIERWQFTVADYHRIGEAGILGQDERFELFAGEVCKMYPLDPAHAAHVDRLNRWLTRSCNDKVIIRVQHPVQLDGYNEFQPDLAVVRWQDSFYGQHHPMPSDVLLVIEVSNSSIDYDREEKLPRYAAAGIPEVWLVHIARQLVEQYTLPIGTDYTHRRIVKRGSILNAQTITGVDLAVDSIFGH